MTIRWLGQSGYIIKTKTTEIIIDPYLSDVVNRVANRPRLRPVPIKPEDIDCDAVICTHDHLDHIDEEAIPKMRETQLFITCVSGKEKILSLNKNNVKTIKAGESITVGDIRVTAVFAAHGIEAFGIIAAAEEKTLYFSGDTLFSEELFKISEYKPDITFICINGKLGNMNVKEAVTAAKKIGAKTNVPNHYDMFSSNSEDPTLFVENIDGGFIMEFNREYTVENTGLYI